MYTPRRTKLQFKIIFEKDPVPMASAQQYHIYIIQILNVLQNTPNCTIDKKSGEYAPIPLNKVCAVIHYLLFLQFFFNFSKIFSKTHQIASFKKIFSGEHAPEPP